VLRWCRARIKVRIVGVLNELRYEVDILIDQVVGVPLAST
jgi:hypothetical protein